MSASSPKACAGHVLETVPPVMQFIRTEMRRHRSLNISVPQFRVLTFLERRSGGSLSDVAERVGLSLPAMSRLIDGLVERKLLTREDSPADRRRIALRITETGRDLVRTAREGALERLAEMLGSLSGDERARVIESMEILRPLFVPSLTVAVPTGG
ncbi:MAG TPA: MarR family transcriptional regulator [Thermoplasmata archaeon]|nr:MarR family transcriptional regulator [Thermoplasmata archaeon]